MAQMVRTRFAPSPTGALHVGGVRTALFDWLWAKKNNGRFILRIEDTDQKRSDPKSVEQIYDALDWLGLAPDEGPREGGPHGPYVQSQRLARYRSVAEEMVARGTAFYCFCTEERLSEVRAAQAAEKRPPRYDGFCLRRSSEEVQRLLRAGEPHVIRLKVPEQGIGTNRDSLRGAVRFSYATVDHAVLLKSDGYPTYHLANVVDDHAMEITHVLRGEEWLPSLPKHILVYDALGWTPPIFTHLPLIFGPDKTKLSKRHGAASVLDYRAQGYLAEALLNFLAFLGWNPKTTQELFSRQELLRAFSLDQLNKSPAIFNIEKLTWFNLQYLRTLPRTTLIPFAKPVLEAAFPGRPLSEVAVGRVLAIAGDRLERLVDLPQLVRFLFVDEGYEAGLLIPEKGDRQETRALLEKATARLEAVEEKRWTIDELRKEVDAVVERERVSRRQLLWPMRVAVTFRAESPGLFEVLAALGRAETLRRLSRAAEKLASSQA